MFLRKLKCAIQKSLLLCKTVCFSGNSCNQTQLRLQTGEILGGWLMAVVFIALEKHLSFTNQFLESTFLLSSYNDNYSFSLLKLIKSQVCLVLLMTYVSAFPMMIEFGPPDFRFLSSNEVRPHLLWRKEESSIWSPEKGRRHPTLSTTSVLAFQRLILVNSA